MDYDEVTLDPTDASDASTARLKAWLDAVSRGFHQGRHGHEAWGVFRTTNLADDVVPRGFWLPEGAFGAGRLPVATFSHFDKTLNVGAGQLLPVRMITDITVSPAHRRRGLLRRMMEPNLADAVASGVPLACLTVSEATIYGRFGFGPATFRRTVEVDTREGFRLDGPVDPGRVELVEPGDHWQVMDDVFTRFHAETRGSVDRPQFYEPLLTGAYDFESGGKDTKIRLAVHLDADGRPDGHALYRFKGWSEKPLTVEVKDLVALGTPALLALWRFLGSVDLSERVTWRAGPDVDVLRWALADAHRLAVKGEGDHIWVRVLDVPVALRARPWYADGRVVLEVTDPQGHAAGRWSVSASGGRATVERTDDEADVAMPVDTLGSLYLGGVDVATLAAAGRLHGSPEAVDRLAALADGGDAPHSVTSF